MDSVHEVVHFPNILMTFVQASQRGFDDRASEQDQKDDLDGCVDGLHWRMLCVFREWSKGGQTTNLF